MSVSKDAGRDLALGESQAVERFLQIGATGEEAARSLARFDGDIYKNFYDPLVSLLDPELALPPEPTSGDIVAAMQESPMHVNGSVDEVRDQLVTEWRRVPYGVHHLADGPNPAVVLLAVEAKVSRVATVLFDALRRENQHAARAGARVVGLHPLLDVGETDHHADHGARSVELAALLAR